MHVLTVAKYDDEGVSLPEREFKAFQFVLNFHSQRNAPAISWPSGLRNSSLPVWPVQCPDPP
jgi:hypothetical protein